MRFGYFDDARREYVITRPDTPLPWINYLGSSSFFTLLSNTAGGYAFYKDARLRRITRYRYNNLPLDSDGFHFYIKENDVVWNPGWQPVQTALDEYECRHGLGRSMIRGKKNGLSASQEMFVPTEDPILLTRLTLKNEGAEEKTFDVFSFIEFCLWDAMDDASNFQRNLSTGEVEVEGRTIFHKTEYRERRDHYAFSWCSEEAEDFDTSRESFMGVYGTPARPEAVAEGRCKNSIAHGWQPVAARRLRISLKPGEEKSLLYLLGYAEVEEEKKFVSPGVINKTEAYRLIDKYGTDESFERAKQKLAGFWEELLSRLRVKSGEEAADRMANIWNQYQCMVTFNLSRSASYFESGMGRGMGFRDSCQDLLGFVHMIPERARERILDIAATQREDGSAYHQYQPLTKKGNSDIGSGFNDDPLWLIAGVSAYLRETGDYSVLKEIVPFDNNPETAASLMEHLSRSLHYTMNNIGPHGLPLIGRADWNDCLNLNCFSRSPGESFQTTGPDEGPVAESVFIAGMFVKYAGEYADICSHIGHPEEAKEARKAAADMEEIILKHGWDGEWFLRAYDAEGGKVGSSDCEEGKIFIEPQGMCVMAGVGINGGEAEKALASVGKHLETPYGIVLLQPAYTSYRLNLGEISSYPPGYKENAGIFCHNNPWIVLAETVLGHGERAFSLYKKTCPAYLEEISEIHRTEPYCYCQMVAGKDAAKPGEGKNSWLTGTAAWTMTALTQGIFGLIPTLDGLKLDPCIPAEWDGFTADRLYRGGKYHITVENPQHVEKGIKEVLVNGQRLTGSLLPLLKENEEAIVRVIMG